VKENIKEYKPFVTSNPLDPILVPAMPNLSNVKEESLVDLEKELKKELE
jgi:hypothetical protein